ncbi:MAG: sulfotransferase domain-containing protein, partial [Flavobacteriales bacterium]
MINQMKEQSNHKLKKEKYFIFNEHDNSEIILEDGTRNNPLDVFKFTSRFRYKRGKVIFLVRDPRDVIISHFYQVTKRSKNPFIFNSISEFVKDDILGFKRIIHFYNVWKRNKDIPQDFLLV